jgi:hypothetical protein
MLQQFRGVMGLTMNEFWCAGKDAASVITLIINPR